MRRIVAAGIIGAVLATGGIAEAKKKPRKKKTPVTTTVAKNPATITMAEFSALQPGMAYDDAVRVIGGPGEVISQVDIAGTSTIMYMWEGRGFGGNANAMFQNGALVSKAQFGLS